MVTPIVSVTVLVGLLIPLPAVSQAISTTPGRAAAETPWPYVVLSGRKRLLVYQPQVSWWDGSHLSASAAVSVTENSEQHPTFGTLRVTAWTLVDKETRQIALDRYAVDVAVFPGVPAGRADEWVEALRSDAATVPKVIGLDRLQAALEVPHAAQKSASQPLGNEPPAIILSTTPAMLISIDGPPVYRDIGSVSYQRVINTRALLLKDTSGRHYLHLRDGWLTAASLNGTWAALRPPPAALDAVSRRLRDDLETDLPSHPAAVATGVRSLTAAAAPVIYVATRATELIVTQGDPQWIPIPNTQLAFAANTSGELFESRSERKIYALVSGRWFRAAAAQSPWEFVRADRLPSDFARIPDNSPKGRVNASVAGTAQAREAVVANDIPQTAAIAIGGVRMSPLQFDGVPRFAPIKRTSLLYVSNASTPVIQVNPTTYYALENGVWFLAASLNGPWRVATVVPAAIGGIPSDSPLYFVTFVRIYGSSGDTVYAGYTEGYRGACVDPHGEVVVYGTGYAYSSWIGTVWHGAPATYGSAVVLGYTPETDWMFVSGTGPRGSIGATGANLYRRWGDGARVSARSTGSHIKNAPERDFGASLLADDLFAGDDGAVYRYMGAEWQRPQQNGWTHVDPGQEVVRALDAARAARSIGSQRWADYRRGAFDSSRSFADLERP